eukprot:36680-Hanusia_phi.AAC.1
MIADDCYLHGIGCCLSLIVLGGVMGAIRSFKDASVAAHHLQTCKRRPAAHDRGWALSSRRCATRLGSTGSKL